MPVKKTTEIAPAEPKKPAQRGPKKPFGSTDDDKALVRKLMTETLNSWQKPKVKSDAELEQRLADYFMECADQGNIPTMEEMALCTGYTLAGLRDIENGTRKGFSPETKRILQRARGFMLTFDTKLVLTGQLNPVTYIFRSKNRYGMSDQTDVFVRTSTQEEREVSAEDIAKRYLADPNTIEQTFEDEPKEGGSA